MVRIEKHRRGGQGGQVIRTIPTSMRGEMANQRKSKARKGWSAVAQRLSSASKGKPAKKAARAGHPKPVESGKPRRLGRVGSVGENLLDVFLRAERIKGYEREYQFHPSRKWRFDFAWPALMIAVEVEGGVWSGGRHTRGKGFVEDCVKYNEAALLGWTIFRCTTDMVRSGQAMHYIETMMLTRRYDGHRSE